MLARDLQSDFVPRFADAIGALASVLEQNCEVETIEQVFTSLCFLLKILRKPLQVLAGAAACCCCCLGEVLLLSAAAA